MVPLPASPLELPAVLSAPPAPEPLVLLLLPEPLVLLVPLMLLLEPA